MRKTEPFLHFHFKDDFKLTPLFLSHSLRSVATSLTSGFSAIYIFKSISSLTGREDLGMLAAFSFFLILYVFKLIGNLFSEELALRRGIKRPMHIGLFLLAVGLAGLAFSRAQPLLLFLVPPVWGIAAGLYWFGWYSLLAKTGRKGLFGEELAAAGGFNTIFLMATPFLGGLLIQYFGYPALFLASLGFTLLSILSLGFVAEKRTHQDTSLSEVLSLFKSHKRMALAYVGNTVASSIYALAVPLFIFRILGGELSLGGFLSLSMILVAIIKLFVGRWVDTRGKSKVMTVGAIAASVVWIGRALTRNITALFAFNVADRITGGMTGVPLEVWSLEKALDGRSTGRAMLFREVAVTTGEIVACLLLIALSPLQQGLEFSFLVAALFSLFPLLSLRNPRRSMVG